MKKKSNFGQLAWFLPMYPKSSHQLEYWLNLNANMDIYQSCHTKIGLVCVGSWQCFRKWSLIVALKTGLPPPQHHLQGHLYFSIPNSFAIAFSILWNLSFHVSLQLVGSTNLVVSMTTCNDVHLVWLTSYPIPTLNDWLTKHATIPNIGLVFV
jgi:hypothetical protein